MINGMSAAQFAQKLVQVERQAKDKLFNEQKHQQEAKIDAYRTLGSALSDVTSSLSNFSNKELQAKKPMSPVTVLPLLSLMAYLQRTIKLK